MLVALRAILGNGGSDHLHHLAQAHRQETLYACVCRGWLNWIADETRYEITEAGRAVVGRD